MSSHSCIIRFVDDDGETQAFVARKEHGHPEEIVTNLSYLQIVVDQQEEQSPPGIIAAQFVFLDTLWYALREVSVIELQEKLWGILYSPAQTDFGEEESYLYQHRLLNSRSEIEAVPYLYELRLSREEKWQIKIGENTHSFDGPVGEVFELVSWDFEGDLSEAIHQMGG